MIHRIAPLMGWLALVLAGPLAAQDPEIIHVGIMDSFVKDLSPDRQRLLDSDFPEAVKEFTGFQSKVLKEGDPFVAAKKMAAGQWHFGVFQGVEFAWAQAKDAKLQPLLLAIGKQRAIHALLVAKKESSMSGFADLKGKSVYVLRSREHCRLFADKGAGGNAQQHFGKVMPTTNSEAALDDILRGKADAAVVDSVTLESYKDIQPGRYNRLKVLAKSEQFPATVIAYYQGVVSKPVVQKFRDGMLEANKTDKGRDTMSEFGITAFEAVPPDYAKPLSEITKAYPAPAK